MSIFVIYLLLLLFKQIKLNTDLTSCDLFNHALNTFYLRLYGVRHMIKDRSDSERGNLLPPHGLLFPIMSGQVRVFNVHIQSKLL